MRNPVLSPAPSILLAYAPQETRSSIETALAVAGYSETTCVSSTELVNDLLILHDFDLLIIGTHLPSWSCGLIVGWWDVVAPIRGGLRRSSRLPVVVLCEASEFFKGKQTAQDMGVHLKALSEFLENPHIITTYLSASKFVPPGLKFRNSLWKLKRLLRNVLYSLLSRVEKRFYF